MKNNGDVGQSIVVTAEDLRRIVRFEQTWKEFLQQASPGDVDLIFEGDYTPAMEDWETAVRNLRAKKADWQQFAGDWFFMFVYDEELNLTLRLPDEPGGVLLPATEEDVACDLYSELLRAYREYDEAENPGTLRDFQEAFPFRDLLLEVQYFREDQDKPLFRRRFTDRSCLAFVQACSRPAVWEKIPEGMRKLSRRMADELCEKGNEQALEIRGYGSYGGSGMYPRDWTVSRDSLLAAYTIEPKSYIANTLGYIYYYGRCNGGIRQYDEAFRWFSCGAAGGSQESRYKLGDMFLDGLGVPKSQDTALHLYKSVYDETLREFCAGEKDGNFADAALRMAIIARKAGERYTELWYQYSLQADYAIRLRLPFDEYGDSQVFVNIQNELSEAGRAYHAVVPKADSIRTGSCSILMNPTEDSTRCLKAILSRTNEKRARLTIFVRNRPDEAQRKSHGTLLTIPEADYCRLQDKISLEIRNIREIRVTDSGNRFYYNYVFWNPEKSGFVFCHDEEVTAFIGADDLIWKAPDRTVSADRQMLRFARVRFNHSGRGYDYLCSDESVQAGDKVIVPGYDGETQAEVVKVFTRAEDDTDLPFEKYKSVIRKCE
ncbi:MAG: hypothetical protein PUE04_07650 [Lachnospira sp.]|nr:hypothetical protein [Lachnospira sp.]